MTRLRAPSTPPASAAAAARKRALDAAADETLWRGTPITEDQLTRLQDAAAYIDWTVAELDALVRPRGRCHEQDTEQWYPLDSDRPELRDDERARARQTCAGCPVQAPCLALSLQYRVEALRTGLPDPVFAETGDHGVWGALCAGDRRQMRRAWANLQADEVLLPRVQELAAALGHRPNNLQVRCQLGIGHDRAQQLLTQLDALRDEAVAS